MEMVEDKCSVRIYHLPQHDHNLYKCINHFKCVLQQSKRYIIYHNEVGLHLRDVRHNTAG